MAGSQGEIHPRCPQTGSGIFGKPRYQASKVRKTRSERYRVSKSVLIRNALEVYLASDVEKPGSALSQAADLAGVLCRPEHLSTNKD